MNINISGDKQSIYLKSGWRQWLADLTQKIAVVMFISVSTMLSPQAGAQAPYTPNLVDGGNKWYLDAYDDADPDHVLLATPGICFEFAGVVGTQQQYTWYSDTFLGWQGTARQEGDQIFMHGVYANGEGRDAIQVRIIIDTPRHGSVGHWQEWRDDGGYGKTIGFANARMIRAAENCTMTAEEALDTGGWWLFPFPKPATNDNPMTFK